MRSLYKLSGLNIENGREINFIIAMKSGDEIRFFHIDSKDTLEKVSLAILENALALMEQYGEMYREEENKWTQAIIDTIPDGYIKEKASEEMASVNRHNDYCRKFNTWRKNSLDAIKNGKGLRAYELLSFHQYHGWEIWIEDFTSPKVLLKLSTKSPSNPEPSPGV